MDGILAQFAPFVQETGIIHFYTFNAGNEIPDLNETFAGRGLIPARYRSCGNVAPGIRRRAFDLVK